MSLVALGILTPNVLLALASTGGIPEMGDGSSMPVQHFPGCTVSGAMRRHVHPATTSTDPAQTRGGGVVEEFTPGSATQGTQGTHQPTRVDAEKNGSDEDTEGSDGESAH